MQEKISHKVHNGTEIGDYFKEPIFLYYILNGKLPTFLRIFLVFLIFCDILVNIMLKMLLPKGHNTPLASGSSPIILRLHIDSCQGSSSLGDYRKLFTASPFGAAGLQQSNSDSKSNRQFILNSSHKAHKDHKDKNLFSPPCRCVRCENYSRKVF